MRLALLGGIVGLIVCSVKGSIVYSVGVAVSAALGGYYFFSYNDCFVEDPEATNYISGNISQKLEDELFGQHLVIGVTKRSVGNHFRALNPSKALVLSFHGPTGTGKNYVAKYIAESIYPNGVKNPNVHLIVSTLHFPRNDRSGTYKSEVQNWIKTNVSKCERSVFIFDEIDKLSEEVIDGIKPFIDFHDTIGGIDYRKSIFIFLSNTGGKQITETVHSLFLRGVRREDIKMEDLESLVLLGAFNENGGLKKSNIIGHHLIDHYVPFLPLEKKHVRLCIIKELKRRNRSLSESQMNRVVNSLQYWPSSNGIYSTSGCKRIGKKLDLIDD